MVDQARKKARIVICGNFQEVHPDEFTASKTPSYPALRMASHRVLGVSTAFLYARLFGDGTDLRVAMRRFHCVPVVAKIVEDGDSGD